MANAIAAQSASTGNGHCQMIIANALTDIGLVPVSPLSSIDYQMTTCAFVGTYSAFIAKATSDERSALKS